MSQQKGPSIVQCQQCGAKNRIKPHADRLRPICGRCGTRLAGKFSEHTTSSVHSSSRAVYLFNVLLILAIAGVCFAIAVTPAYLRKDFSELITIENEKTKKFRAEQEEKLSTLEVRLQAELAGIDPSTLRRSAKEHYKSIMDSRTSYDRRYALSSREKALLKMSDLAKDSTKSYHEAIKEVAKEASPSGADIRITESHRGIELHINFDMSSMTSGEHGTRTKHHTKESLKKEVISLSSRVTNDLFQFCRDLDLDTIYVGCKHYVRTRYGSGITRDENKTLYKMRIRKRRIKSLSTNPFLDIYSTKKYFEVEEDNFADIEIIQTRT